jgi:hypothetical protein
LRIITKALIVSPEIVAQMDVHDLGSRLRSMFDCGIPILKDELLKASTVYLRASPAFSWELFDGFDFWSDFSQSSFQVKLSYLEFFRYLLAEMPLHVLSSLVNEQFLSALMDAAEDLSEFGRASLFHLLCNVLLKARGNPEYLQCIWDQMSEFGIWEIAEGDLECESEELVILARDLLSFTPQLSEIGSGFDTWSPP